MKEITLLRGEKVLVDDEDYSELSKYRWRKSTFGYAIRHIMVDKKVVNIWMHRQIMNTPKGMDTDHINRNRLDNRRSNLRVATRSINSHNVGVSRNNKSGYLGVVWYPSMKKYLAVTMIDKVKHKIGWYKTAAEAGEAYKNFVAANLKS